VYAKNLVIKLALSGICINAVCPGVLKIQFSQTGCINESVRDSKGENIINNLNKAFWQL
jgi:hypothetical protein